MDKRTEMKNPFIDYVAKLFATKKEKLNPVHELVNTYHEINGTAHKHKEFYKGRYDYRKLASEAKRLLVACDGNLEDAMWAIDKMKYKAEKGKFDWSIITTLKYNLRE